MEPRICPACGHEFEPDAPKQIYCKDSRCYNAREAARMRAKRAAKPKRAVVPTHCKKCGRALVNVSPFAYSLKWCRDCADQLRLERKRQEYYKQKEKAQAVKKAEPTEQEKADMLRAAMRKMGY